MKTLLALAAVLITTSLAAQAEVVRGHFRSNGTYVMPYYRTPANCIPYDNLSYRGYPSQQPGYTSPGQYGSSSGVALPSGSTGGSFGGGLQTMPKLGRANPIRPLKY